MKRSDLIKSIPPQPMTQDTKHFLIGLAVAVAVIIFHSMM